MRQTIKITFRAFGNASYFFDDGVYAPREWRLLFAFAYTTLQSDDIMGPIINLPLQRKAMAAILDLPMFRLAMLALIFEGCITLKVLSSRK